MKHPALLAALILLAVLAFPRALWSQEEPPEEPAPPRRPPSAPT